MKYFSISVGRGVGYTTICQTKFKWPETKSNYRTFFYRIDDSFYTDEKINTNKTENHIFLLI
jgi:hypothetical protein